MAPQKRKKKNAYVDPTAPGALGGVSRYARAQGLKEPAAHQALQKELAYTLHRPPHHRFPTTPVMVFNIDQQWVVDLVEMQPYWRENWGVRYLLTVVDVLSKYAWVRPIKCKTGAEVVRAFQSIVDEGRRPQTLQTDQGKEFYNATVQRWLKQEGIRHFSTSGDAKAAIAERFNCTLKTHLHRYFTAANTFHYMDALPPLVAQYNADVHRSISMAPQDVDVTNEAEVWHRLYGQRTRPRRSPLQVGNMVRLTERVKPFKKGYLPQWTEEVFRIRRVDCGPWTGVDLPGGRIRWYARPRHLLRARSAKGDGGAPSALARGKST